MKILHLGYMVSIVRAYNLQSISACAETVWLAVDARGLASESQTTSDLQCYFTFYCKIVLLEIQRQGNGL